MPLFFFGGRLMPLFFWRGGFWNAQRTEATHETAWFLAMKAEADRLRNGHLAKSRNQTTAWWGVRNYQARNFMRDGMRLGDQAFFYHSGCAEPGIVGIVTISRLA